MKIGIDLAEHKDFIDKKRSFIERVLSLEEQALYDSFQSSKRKLEYLASRWAVKEAVIKCLGHSIPFNDIVVLNKENGSPYVKIKNKTETFEISLSHTDNYSVAVAVLL